MVDRRGEVYRLDGILVTLFVGVVTVMKVMLPLLAFQNVYVYGWSSLATCTRQSQKGVLEVAFQHQRRVTVTVTSLMVKAEFEFEPEPARASESERGFHMLYSDSIESANGNGNGASEERVRVLNVNDTQYQLRFGGVGRLYAGKSKNPSKDDTEGVFLIMDRLRSAVVVVIGLGGVGSWAAEALCRSGVGTLVLIDLDDVCISNMNRQLHALSSTAGQMKIDAMRERLMLINPACNILRVHDFVTKENVDDIFGRAQNELRIGVQITAVLDAIDGAKEKAAIISYCDRHKLPVVTCGGAAGRSDPGQIQRRDLTLVTGDKLLASCKKELRKNFGFKAGLPFRELQKGRKVKKWSIDCVYSDEEVTASDISTATNSSLRQCDGALGTACFVTGTFGFAAAAAIVNQIANDKLCTPRGRL